MRVVKGHGTQNDFVVVPDMDGALDLTPQLVRALCDRHAGIGADGVLRVVRSAKAPEVAEVADRAEFFMDYRNADGSIAETCGNGIRVFMRYLQAARLVEQDAAVATRGGIVSVRSSTDGDISVQMGLPLVLADRPVVTAAPVLRRPATAVVAMPNPHVVIEVDEGELAAVDLRQAPRVDQPLPHGQNVEFVHRAGPNHLRMRVHERGVGETRSCGTGICAAVVACAGGADGVPWRVDVPGGRCTVTWTDDGVELCGPAVLVGEIELSEQWLAQIAAS